MLHREMTVQELRACLESHLPRFYRVALAITGDHHDAEDAVQDAAMKAVAARESFRGEAEACTWVHRIVVNAANDRVTRRNRELQRGEAAIIEARWQETTYSVDPAEVAVAAVNQLTLRGAIDKLSPSQRTAVVLHDVEQWTSKEIAEVMGLPQATVKSHLRRARHALVSLLAEEAA